MQTWDIAEEACKKQLALTSGNEEEGMKRLGTRTFTQMVLAVEAVLEKFTEKEEFER